MLDRCRQPSRAGASPIAPLSRLFDHAQGSTRDLPLGHFLIIVLFYIFLY